MQTHTTYYPQAKANRHAPRVTQATVVDVARPPVSSPGLMDASMLDEVASVVHQPPKGQPTATTS